LYDIFKEESIITKLNIFIKYNYERTRIENTLDQRNWKQLIYSFYQPESENHDEVPDISGILKLLKQGDFKLKVEIARIIIERILIDYKLHLVVFSKKSPIHNNLAEEMEVLNNASSIDMSSYIAKYRELRSNFACLEDEINAYNETEKKMDEIEIDFLEKVGSLELKYKELALEKQKLEWKIEYKNTHPEAGPDEIEQQLLIAMEEWKEELKKIAELEEQTKEAKLHKAYEQSFLKSAFSATIDSGTRSDNYLRLLKSESRRESKRTIKMAHPDILNNHECFDILSESQKAEIEKLRNEELEHLEKIDKYSSKMSSEYYMQLIEKSQEARNKIDRILKFSGIPVNSDFIIEGNTINERIADIGKRMKLIDIKIFEWKTKRANLPKDMEKKRRVGIMANEGAEAYISSLKMHISPLEKKVESLTQSYNIIEFDRVIEHKRIEFEKKYNIKIPVELITPLLQLTRQFVKNKPIVDATLLVLETACVICRDSNKKELKHDHFISALAQDNGIDKKAIYTYFLE